MVAFWLIRYGAIPEVARFRAENLDVCRGDSVVVESHRGLQIGRALQQVSRSEEVSPDDATGFRVLRVATETDQAELEDTQNQGRLEFDDWQQRIANWNLELELLDLEWTLDREKLILYVINGRGPDCTKLALQAAAAGLGLIEVQPVDASGLVQLETAGGGCGSGGCGSGGCSS